MNSTSPKQPEGRPSIKARLVPAAIILAGIVVVFLLTRMKPAEKPLQPASPSVVNVKVQAVQPVKDLSDMLEISGVVEPNRVIEVAAEVAGKVEAVGARSGDLSWQGRVFKKGKTLQEGEPVEKGQCLIVLNKDLLQATYNQAKAQAEYDQREFDRVSQLYAKNVAGKSEMDQISTKLEVSKATFDSAGQQLKRTEMNAPFSGESNVVGILDDLTVDIGEYVAPGTVVAKLVDTALVKITVNVPERDVNFLKTGDAVNVTCDSSGCDEKRVKGCISYISETADSQTHTTRVEISIDNKDRLLRTGQIVAAHIQRQMLHDAVLVPLETIIPMENGHCVYVAVEGKARQRQVKLGLMQGFGVQILGGLKAGDNLIVSGQRLVSDGQLVKVVQ